MIQEIERELAEAHIPTGWDIYEWAAENPDTAIAHSLKRVEKVFDLSTNIYLGASGGKDSSIAQELSALELLRRRDRVKRGVKRDGSLGIDPLDAKWAHHLLPDGELKDKLNREFGTRPRKLVASSMDAEWIYTATENALKETIKLHGPEGDDTIDFFWFCLQLGWQNGTSFSDARLNSWDPSKKDMWIRPLPELAGITPITNDTLNSENLVPFESVSVAAQEFFEKTGQVIQKDGRSWVANFGYGSLENDKTGTYMTLKGLDEDFFQEYFSKWFANISSITAGASSIEELIHGAQGERDVWDMKIHESDFSGDIRYTAPSSLISLRATESFDRRTILLQGEYSTGQYSRSNGVNTCSVVFDYTTADIWRLFAATDWPVSTIYNDMYEAGIPVDKQRTGSLLNYAATRNISDVKAIEPALYARITARFSNVEFFSQFSKSGYYKIQKPADMSWDGRNHIKAGMSLDDQDKATEIYKRLLDHLNIDYKYFNHVFKDMKINLDGLQLAPGMEDTAYFKSMERSGFKAIRPLQELKKLTGLSLVELAGGPESQFTEDLDIIHNSWRDYSLFLINTSNQQALENTREKIVVSITSWKYATGSAPETTISALKVLSDFPEDLSLEINDQNWEADSYITKGRLNISGKYKLSLSQYPMESLENMAQKAIQHLLSNKDEALLSANEEFMKLAEVWEQTDGQALFSLEVSKAFFAGNDWISETLDRYKTEETLERFSPAWYAAMERAIKVWFKEDIHSTSSWKRLAVATLKGAGGVPDWGYIGFAPTFKERLARAEALQAFSSTQEEKNKAIKEAEKLQKSQA